MDCAGTAVYANPRNALRSKPECVSSFLRSARLLPVIVILLITICLPVAAGAEIVERIVAVVNDSIITLSELNAATAAAIDAIGGKTKDEKEAAGIKSKMLDTLVEQKLVRHAADRAGIEVSEREIDNAIEDVKQQNKLNQETFMLALAQSGLTFREYKEQLREQIRQVKFINKEFRSKINVTDDEVAQYYQRNSDEFYGPQSFDIAMIYISSDGVDEKTVRLKLEKIRDGLDKGDSFGLLARLFSNGVTAAAGGEMGSVKSGELDSAIEEAAVKLAPGEVSQPIVTPSGIYIVKLNRRAEPALKPITQVSEQIKDKLFKKSLDDRFRFWLEETKRFAHIDIRL